MTIDDKRQYTLSRFYKYKTRTSTVESDHNVLILQLGLKWNRNIRKERKEIYNVKNISYQKIFNENTSNNRKLIEVLQNTDIFQAGAKWIKELKHMISISFKKIRISNSTPKIDMKMLALLKQRENLKLKISDLNTVDKKVKRSYNQKLEAVENEIADLDAEEKVKVIKEHVGHLIDDTENLNCIKMWKLKKKLCPAKAVKPVAKKNQSGELVTQPAKLKEMYESTYKNRLRHRLM